MRAVQSLILLAISASACASLDLGFAPSGLEGAHWSLASLGAERAPVEQTQSEPYVEFGAEPRRLIGSDGCNRFTATYRADGDALALGPIAATRMACELGQATEAGFAAALGATAKWAIVEGKLELYDAGGALLASFRGRALD